MNPSVIEGISPNLLRFVGYGLLFFTLANYAEALIPPRFAQDPNWEFQTLGALVNTAPLPIIGFSLIFFGESKARSPIGRTILPIVAWLPLLLGIGYLVMMFVGISATLRLNTEIATRANFVLTQQQTQFQTAKDNLKSAKDENLTEIAKQLLQRSPSGSEAIKENQNNPNELRKQFEGEIQKTESTARSRIEEDRTRTSRQLLKQSLKWNAEALVSSILLIGLWAMTGWSRKKSKKKRGKSSAALDLSELTATTAAPTETTETKEIKAEDTDN
ncbi:MAG: HpsJ family protein [Pseudanabaena sp. ELA607]